MIDFPHVDGTVFATNCKEILALLTADDIRNLQAKNGKSHQELSRRTLPEEDHSSLIQH
jgi:hypothetical protein